MKLVITLRKEIANRYEGEQVFEAVIEKLSDRPDIKISGHVTNHFIEEEPS